MFNELNEYNPINKREVFDKKLVKILIRTSHKLGLGLDTKNNMQELAEELHKPSRKRFEKRKVIPKDIDEIWTADLIALDWLKDENKNYRYSSRCRCF